MIDLHDQKVMFQNSLLFYKNRLVFVDRLIDTESAILFDLKKQEMKEVDWDYEKASAPTRRLGMVNGPYGAVYMQRVPRRRFSVGLRYDEEVDNIAVSLIDGATYAPRKKQAAVDTAYELRGMGVYDCIMNKYPTIDEAFRQAIHLQQVTAFDKQFAVDANLQVFYKTKRVGSINGPSIEAIEWLDGHKHLGMLLQDNWKKPITKAS